MSSPLHRKSGRGAAKHLGTRRGAQQRTIRDTLALDDLWAAVAAIKRGHTTSARQDAVALVGAARLPLMVNLGVPEPTPRGGTPAATFLSDLVAWSERSGVEVQASLREMQENEARLLAERLAKEDLLAQKKLRTRRRQPGAGRRSKLYTQYDRHDQLVQRALDRLLKSHNARVTRPASGRMAERDNEIQRFSALALQEELAAADVVFWVIDEMAEHALPTVAEWATRLRDSKRSLFPLKRSMTRLGLLPWSLP